MVQGCEALTDKEKQTLRLLLAGHDAKSMARHFDLSVHTINERLRDARRKLSVSSSKEAARLLRRCEDTTSDSVGDVAFGDALPAPTGHPADQPEKAAATRRRTVRAIGGLAMMTSILIATLALLAPAQVPEVSVEASRTAPAETTATTTARDWLALVDAARWEESYAATGQSFRSLNTIGAWRSASEKARGPLGRVVSRTLLDEQDVPAPPNGLRTVRFRTDFANRRGATETLSLDREGDRWKIVGIYID